MPTDLCRWELYSSVIPSSHRELRVIGLMIGPATSCGVVVDADCWLVASASPSDSYPDDSCRTCQGKIQRRTGRSRSHVSEEVLELVPPRVHCDPATAVALIAFVVGVSAALDHTLPISIFKEVRC
jgi:hypothetical protein